MKSYIKIALVLILITVVGLAPAQQVSAAPDLRPITIDGVVYDKNHAPVAGLTVVAW